MQEAGFDQKRVLDFLASPDAYDPPPGQVERIETHASVVFLAGDRAYKVKRAVKYPFLDFSTLTLRRRACLNELSVNRRTAPELYLDVAPVTAEPSGRLAISGEGEPVEWVLIMRRFDQASLYDRLAEAGRLPLESMPPLARVIAEFHRLADRQLASAPAISRLQRVLNDNDASFTVVRGIPPELLPRLNAANRDALAALVPLLAERALGGYVRHCHGDLHLRNIVEIDGAPIVFDAIEFDDAIATVDILYDLAFLLMDLGVRGLEAHANVLLNAYLDETGDTGNLLGLAALPLFLSMRAMIRAKVELLRGELAEEPQKAEALESAISYLTFAQDRLLPRKARLVAIGGLSGSGKSSVSRALAPRLGGFPGAVILQSDRERKRLFGAGAFDRLPEPAYREEVSDTVYRSLRKRALMALAAGRTAIVDAVHAKLAERQAVAEIAQQSGADFTGIWLEAPAATMKRRIATRGADVSDATPGVLSEQLDYDLGPQDFSVVDASAPLDAVVRTCLAIVGGSGTP
jgi:aminoglycoside phosphotransferase family enzyme/predicted kinase